MRITTAYSTRYTKLDTLWSSHVAAAASVACCARCNRSKSNTFSFEEWVEVGKAIKRFRKTHGIQ